MTVKIITAPHSHLWYREKIGETFEVQPHPKDKDVWQVIEKPVPYLTLLIRKSHCQEVD